MVGRAEGPIDGSFVGLKVGFKVVGAAVGAADGSWLDGFPEGPEVGGRVDFTVGAIKGILVTGFEDGIDELGVSVGQNGHIKLQDWVMVLHTANGLQQSAFVLQPFP